MNCILPLHVEMAQRGEDRLDLKRVQLMELTVLLVGTWRSCLLGADHGNLFNHQRLDDYSVLKPMLRRLGLFEVQPILPRLCHLSL